MYTLYMLILKACTFVCLSIKSALSGAFMHLYFYVHCVTVQCAIARCHNTRGDETKVLHFELPLAYCVYCINCKYFILHILHSKLPPISTASSSSAPHSYFSTKRNTSFGILEWHFCYTNCVAKVHSIWQRIPWHIPFCPKHIIRSPPFKTFISRM